MEIKGTEGTEGTQAIEHDWDRIKLPTDRYKVTRMEVKVFRYKIIEEGVDIMSIMIFNNYIPKSRQDDLYKYIEGHDFSLEDAFVLIDNKTKKSHIFLNPFSHKLEDRLYKKMEGLRKG